MIEIFVFVILVGMFFVDARLSRMVAIQRAILEEIRKMVAERQARCLPGEVKLPASQDG